MESLALRFRPRSFDDLVGQNAVQVVLRTMVATTNVPTAMLFDGPRGTGKTTTARILGAAVNCDTPPGPCGHCPSCKAVFDTTSLDVMELDAASNGLVDDIRTLRNQVMYSVGGTHRVVILDEAHSMSTAAFNALLKILEEPPPGTVFLLLTTEPGRIPDTVISRCMRFTFRRITPAAITARLAHICAVENLQVDPDLLALLAERADGGMRDAVTALDQITRVGITSIDAYTDLTGDIDYAPALLTALTTGDIPAAYTTVTQALARTGDSASITADLVSLLRDLHILKAGGTLTIQGQSLDARTRLAAQLDPVRVLAGLKVLWDLKTRIRPGEDARAALDLAVAMLGDVLAPKPAPTAPTAARKLSLADMAAMRR